MPLMTSQGAPLLDLNNSVPLQNIFVFVQLDVCVVDSSGVPATTTLRASIPVSPNQGMVNTWCSSQSLSAAEPQTYLDGADLIVGSAGTTADFALLKTVVGLPLESVLLPPNVIQSFSSRSESKLHFMDIICILHVNIHGVYHEITL